MYYNLSIKAKEIKIMIKKLGLQLYSVRDYMTDPEKADSTLKQLSAMGYSEAHTAGQYGMSDEAFAKILNKNGISIIGTHYDYDKIINDPEGTVRTHKLWNTTNIGIGGMPIEARNTLEGLKKFINDFNKAAEMYAKEGFKLTYHNHHFEFLRIDGTKTLMDYLCEELDPANVSFVLDTCWVQAACADLDEWMDKLAGRIDILHCKDVMLRRVNDQLCGWMTEVGNGFVNWKAVIEKAEKIGVKHYVVEQDTNFIDNNALTSMKVSADHLKKFMA